MMIDILNEKPLREQVTNSCADNTDSIEECAKCFYFNSNSCFYLPVTQRNRVISS